MGAGVFGARSSLLRSLAQEMDELSTTTIGGCRGGELEDEYTENFWVWKVRSHQRRIAGLI